EPGAEEAAPHSVWSWNSAASARKGEGSGGGGDGVAGRGGGGDGRLAPARREEWPAAGLGWQEDDRGRPPSHVGRTPRSKQTTSPASTIASPQPSAPAPPAQFQPKHILRRSSQEFRERVREADTFSTREVEHPSASTIATPSPRSSFGSDWSVSTPSRRSGSPPSALASPTSSGKKGIAGPLLTRGRSFFGTGTGGTAQMFASSPRGARAARRARSFSQHRTTTSVWARPDTPKKEGAMMQSAAFAATMDRAAVSPETDLDDVVAAAVLVVAAAEARARASSWEETATEEATTAEEMEGTGTTVRGSTNAGGGDGFVGSAGAGGGLASSAGLPDAGSSLAGNAGGAGGSGQHAEKGAAVNSAGVAGSSGGGNPSRRARAPSEDQGRQQARGRSPTSANGYPPPMPSVCTPRSKSTPPSQRGRRQSPTLGAAPSPDYLSPSSSDTGACSPPAAVSEAVRGGGGGGNGRGRGHPRSPSVGSVTRSGSRLSPSLVLARAGLRSVPRGESAFGTYAGRSLSSTVNAGSAKAT
ncbi:unnamed protein product, partial [Laminaria digitata]